MSSAPPGWHLQPDGRERYWDGERWTDQFREPDRARTEQIPLGETQGMPTASAGDQSGYAGARPGAYQSPGGYSPPPGHGDAYPREPYVGQGGPMSDRPGGTPGWLKGCLIALLVVIVLAAIAVGVGWWLINRAVDNVASPQPSETTAPTTEPTDTPTDEPTGSVSIPTTIPSLPTDLPSIPGSGVTVVVEVGEGFTFGPAEIKAGWGFESQPLGFRTVTMTVIPQETSSVPVVFTMRFLSGSDEELGATVCTAPLTTVGQEESVACIPVHGEVENAEQVQVSGIGG